MYEKCDLFVTGMGSLIIWYGLVDGELMGIVMGLILIFLGFPLTKYLRGSASLETEE